MTDHGKAVSDPEVGPASRTRWNTLCLTVDGHHLICFVVVVFVVVVFLFLFLLLFLLLLLLFLFFSSGVCCCGDCSGFYRCCFHVLCHGGCCLSNNF